MTVKELKEILDTCNDDASVLIADWSGTSELKDYEVWATPDGTSVIFDTTIFPPTTGEKND